MNQKVELWRMWLMRLNKEKDKAYCPVCKTWKSLLTEVINPEPEWKCLDCDSLLGYNWDLEED